MKKYTLVIAALLVSGIAVAGTKPPSNAPAQATPQSMQQTSRMSARTQMAACQKKAKDLKGAAKEQAVQNCMRGH